MTAGIVRLAPLLLLVACAAPLRLEYAPGQVTPAVGRGVVVAEDATAAEIGAAVLREGGNAVDAAVAAAFALAVTYPQAGSPGGGGFAVVFLPGEEPAAFDFRETAPSGATADMFLRPDGKVDAALARRSLLSSGVPGTVSGLAALHAEAGTLPWARLVEPAVELARDGFAIPAALARALEQHRKPFLSDPEASAIYVRSDRPWRAGDVLVQSALGGVLAEIRDRGAAGFGEGSAAAAIAGKMAASGGIVTADDLAGYRPVRREPARFAFRGREVITMPLPSSAGVVLRQILATYDMSGGAATRPGSPDRIHLFVESERRAFADRNAFLGDPAGVPGERVRALCDSEMLRDRAAAIDRIDATPSFAVRPAAGDAAETTHLCVIDAAGGAVSMTISLNATFGSHIVAGGVLLNSHMDDFAARPGAANSFGLRQGEANAIRPGRRPLSSMSPTVVREGGEVVLVLGAAGGPRILSAVAQVIVGRLGDGLRLDVALLVPRVHHQHSPDRLDHEDARVIWPGGVRRPDLELGPATIEALVGRGHVLRIRPSGIGRVTAASRDPLTGAVLGVAGPRTAGGAVAE